MTLCSLSPQDRGCLSTWLSSWELARLRGLSRGRWETRNARKLRRSRSCFRAPSRPRGRAPGGTPRASVPGDPGKARVTPPADAACGLCASPPGGAPRPPPPRASTGRSLRRRPAPGSCALASPAPHAALRNAGRALAWGPLAHGEVAEQDPRSSRLSLGPWLPRPCGGLSPAALRNSGDAFEARLRKGCVPEEQSEPPSLRSSRVPV